MRRPAPRSIALMGALGLTLAATAWVASVDETPAAPPAPRGRRAAVVNAALPAWPAGIAASRPAWPTAEAQALRAWGDAVPTAEPVPTAAPDVEAAADDAEPPPPPFPYRLVGRLTDGTVRAVLDNELRSRVAAAGDVIDGQWRIEGIDAVGLRLRHLPDGPVQTLAFPPP